MGTRRHQIKTRGLYYKNYRSWDQIVKSIRGSNCTLLILFVSAVTVKSLLAEKLFKPQGLLLYSHSKHKTKICNR